MNPNIVLHVGFSKTGTTTLQHHLFGKHSQVRYLGKPYTDEFLKEEIHRLIRQDSLVYDPSGLKQYLTDRVFNGDGAAEKLVLISEEMLVSYSKVRDKGMVARRLRDVFPTAKIIITIRNQFEILKSAYLSRGRLLEYVPSKYSGLHVTFDDWLRLSYRNIERSYLGHIDYFKTVDRYGKLFGKENVCVLLLEEFVLNRNEYLNKMAVFLNIDREECMKLTEDKHEHKEITQAQLNFERFRSRFYPLSRVPLLFKPVDALFRLRGAFRKEKTARVTVSEEWQKQLRTLYREGNKKLAENYVLPLEKYNYPL
jgi:hypothetical protein